MYYADFLKMHRLADLNRVDLLWEQVGSISYVSLISGGSRNFKTGGRGPGAVEFLGFGGLFLCPLHTYPMFCSECRDQSTYCKHCMMARIKVYACYTVRIYKNKPPTNFKQGGARPARRCWIRLCLFKWRYLNLLHFESERRFNSDENRFYCISRFLDICHKKVCLTKPHRIYSVFHSSTYKDRRRSKGCCLWRLSQPGAQISPL